MRASVLGVSAYPRHPGRRESPSTPSHPDPGTHDLGKHALAHHDLAKRSPRTPAGRSYEPPRAARISPKSLPFSIRRPLSISGRVRYAPVVKEERPVPELPAKDPSITSSRREIARSRLHRCATNPAQDSNLRTTPKESSDRYSRRVQNFIGMTTAFQTEQSKHGFGSACGTCAEHEAGQRTFAARIRPRKPLLPGPSHCGR